MKIALHKAGEPDARELYEIQIRSFQALYEKYRDTDTNPGAETFEKTLRRLGESETEYFFVCLDGARIGAVRVRGQGERMALKQICILPEFQGFGYAQAAIALVEESYPEAKRWELDTILQEEKLRHLYEKMGYMKTGRIEPIQPGMDIVYYEKRR